MRRPNEEEEEEGGEAEGKGDSAPLLLHDVPLPLQASEGGVRPRRLPLPSTSLAIDSSALNPLRRTSLSPASSRYSFYQVSRGPSFLSPRRRSFLQRLCSLLGFLFLAFLSSLFWMSDGQSASGWVGRVMVQGGWWTPAAYIAECKPPQLPKHPSLPPSLPRVFFALNLKDNEALMPHLRAKLLETLAFFPNGSEGAYVSIYESNSKDRTPEALDALKVELEALSIAHTITTRGQERRGRDEDRISFLVKMRNTALGPLFSPEHQHRLPYDKIVFINDVYFCPWQVLRLLSLVTDGEVHAHWACGMDFKKPAWTDGIWRAFKGLYTGPRFYDIWVARDVEGERFQEDPPFVLHPPPLSPAGKEEGRRGGGREGGPFPVYCCWNGMVAMEAEPFYRGLRFRAARPSLPIQSECSLLCDDFWASGLGHVLVDPSVTLAYDARTDLALPPALPPALSPALSPAEFPASPPEAVRACYLEPGPRKKNKRVDYSTCSTRPPMAHALSASKHLCLPPPPSSLPPSLLVLILPRLPPRKDEAAYLRHKLLRSSSHEESWEEMHPGPAFSLVLRSEAEAAAEILAAKEGGREGGREGGHLPWLPRMQAAVKSTPPSPLRRLNLGLSLLLLLTEEGGGEEGRKEGRGALVDGRQEALRSIACTVSELEGGVEVGGEEMVVLQEGRDVQSTFEEEEGGEEGGRGSILFPSLQASATRAKMAKHILGWCEAQEKRN
ncbi:hypothetical protein VYU27_005655 [Nannochloropsis oceanica]